MRPSSSLIAASFTASPHFTHPMSRQPRPVTIFHLSSFFIFPSPSFVSSYLYLSSSFSLASHSQSSPSVTISFPFSILLLTVNCPPHPHFSSPSPSPSTVHSHLHITFTFSQSPLILTSSSPFFPISFSPHPRRTI